MPEAAHAAPWRYAGVTPRCRYCAAELTAGGRSRQFCGSPCRQAAYRARLSQGEAAGSPLAAPAPPAGHTRTATGIYECPGCGERLAGQRRCPDCNLFARRLGDGGACPGCGEVITVVELLSLD